MTQYHHVLDEVTEHFESQPVKLQFCCAPLIFRCIDPELLFDFQEKYKNITLEMLELSDVDCDKYVEENVTRLGLLAIPENRHGEKIPYTLVKTFPLYLFVHKDNPLAKKYHFEPKVAFESADANQLISLVNKGRGVALSLEPMYDQGIYGNLVMVPFDDKDITWSIAFIYQDYERLSNAAHKFMSFIIENVR